MEEALIVIRSLVTLVRAISVVILRLEILQAPNVVRLQLYLRSFCLGRQLLVTNSESESALIKRSIQGTIRLGESAAENPKNKIRSFYAVKPHAKIWTYGCGLTCGLFPIDFNGRKQNPPRKVYLQILAQILPSLIEVIGEKSAQFVQIFACGLNPPYTGRLSGPFISIIVGSTSAINNDFYSDHSIISL